MFKYINFIFMYTHFIKNQLNKIINVIIMMGIIYSMCWNLLSQAQN